MLSSVIDRREVSGKAFVHKPRVGLNVVMASDEGLVAANCIDVIVAAAIKKSA